MGTYTLKEYRPNMGDVLAGFTPAKLTNLARFGRDADGNVTVNSSSIMDILTITTGCPIIVE